MSVGRFVVVRHGQSTGNVARRFSPDPEVDLTEDGIEQARRAGRQIRSNFSPTHVVSSPYHRTRRTAELIVAELADGVVIEIDEDLREREIGDLAGEPYRAMRQDPTYDAASYWEWRPRNGESLEDVEMRVAVVMRRLAAAYPDEDTVVVSHGGTILALCAHVDGGFTDRRVAGNCEILVVEHSPSADWKLIETAEAVPSAGPEETAG